LSLGLIGQRDKFNTGAKIWRQTELADGLWTRDLAGHSPACIMAVLKKERSTPATFLSLGVLSQSGLTFIGFCIKDEFVKLGTSFESKIRVFLFPSFSDFSGLLLVD